MDKKKRAHTGSFGDTRPFLTRKGFVIQFNWIFILIAGALFLAFFVAFSFRYSSLQEERTQLEILQNLDLAIANLQASPFRTTTSMQFPLTTFFTCNTIRIEDAQYPTSNIIAAPTISKEAVLASFPIKAPYPFATLTIILPATPKYVIVVPDTDAEFVQQLKEDLNLLPITIQEDTKEQPGKTYFYFNQRKSNRISFTESTITFPDGKQLSYYSNAHLYALLFSSQPECSQETIQQQFQQQTQQLLQKLTLLESPACSYTIMQEKLLALTNNPSKENQLAALQANKALLNQNCPGVF